MKNKIILTLLSIALVMTMSGCGKDEPAPTPEKADLTDFSNDIYAKEGEIDEPKDKDETYVDTSVDTKGLLADALKGVTSVRMTTVVNVAALPTSVKDTDESVESITEENTEITEGIEEESTEKEGETGVKGVKKSLMDAPTEDNSTQKESVVPEKKEDSQEETTEESVEEPAKESVEETNEETAPVFIPTDESSYYVNMKVSTDIDSTMAKTYGRLRMNLGAEVDKEEASYVDFSVEPAQYYEVKHNVIRGQEGEEEVTSEWYKEESDFIGIATIKEILEKSTILSYNDAVDSHTIGLNVDKELAKKLDVTNSVMDILFEGKDTVPMTCSISKADGILTRIVITMDGFEGKLSKVDVQTNNYVITFDKYNSINKVMIPDTVLADAKTITGHENFLSDEELIKYNFEKLEVEQEIETNGVVTKEEPIEENESEESKGSADEALKATQTQ